MDCLVRKHFIMAQCALFRQSPGSCTTNQSFISHDKTNAKFSTPPKIQPQYVDFAASFRRKGKSSIPHALRISSSSVKGLGHILLPSKKLKFKQVLGNSATSSPSERNMSTSSIFHSLNKGSMTVKASSSSDDGFPPMQTKPAWYWRLWACIPYLIPIHSAWIHAEISYELHGILEYCEWLSMPFFAFLADLPGWFFTVFFIANYIGIVRSNRWPHFLRFHVMNGMLLEMSLDFCATVGQFIPTIFMEGKLGMYTWFFISWTYLLVSLRSFGCAIRGMYADVPFLSQACYMQIPR